jgi:hypothetical protein
MVAVAANLSHAADVCRTIGRPVGDEGVFRIDKSLLLTPGGPFIKLAAPTRHRHR